jgi:hypothetical protein
MLMVMVSLLPDHLHHSMLDGIMTLERRIGIVAFLLLGLIVYWALRLYRLS